MLRYNFTYGKVVKRFYNLVFKTPHQNKNSKVMYSLTLVFKIINLLGRATSEVGGTSISK